MAIVGYNVIGGSEDFDAPDDGDINGPYTVGAGATLNEFWAYLRSFSNVGSDPKFRPIVYQDSGGEPGALISTLTEISVLRTATTGQWYSVTGLSVAVPSNSIWIGLWYLNNNHRYAYDTVGENIGRYHSNIAPYSSTNPAPTPWDVSGDITTTQKHSMYVVYTPSSATQLTAGHGSGMGHW